AEYRRNELTGSTRRGPGGFARDGMGAAPGVPSPNGRQISVYRRSKDMHVAAWMLALTLHSPAQSACHVPAHIQITAPEPCFVAARIEKEWPELEARVKFVRETLELPYQPMSLNDAHFHIVEHAQEFQTTDGDEV